MKKSLQVLMDGRDKSYSCFSGAMIHWSNCSMFQGAVSEEGFAGGLLQENRAVAEELVDFIAFFQRDEEDFALAFAPECD